MKSTRHLKALEEILCPVCRKYKFEEESNYDICNFCMWENDGSKKEFEGSFGPNRMSISEYRKEYKLKKGKK